MSIKRVLISEVTQDGGLFRPCILQVIKGGFVTYKDDFGLYDTELSAFTAATKEITADYHRQLAGE